MAPPRALQTPLRKRRKVSGEEAKPPPITPTPSLVGFMTSKTPVASYSTGDIDDTNTRGNVSIFSNFENGTGTAASNAEETTSTLLADACRHLLAVEPKLKPVMEAHHCRIFAPEGLAETIDPFRSLASGIMAQQVSGAAASSIKNKFISLFSTDTAYNHAGPPHFPPPALVAATPIPTLRTAGLSQRKAEYIQGLAEKFVSGELSTVMLMQGSDEDVMEKLVAVRGLGKWSVEMFMCFGLKRMDVFSTGDLGVQRGMAALMGRDVAKLKAKGGGKWKYMSEKDMLDISAKFAPYRSLFMWYMWRIEDVKVEALQDEQKVME
ncbi:3-methyladenine DNA glycosylase [Taxawa tesnikishii (nom. ined.)]|nr:3-methyladenine DNA glycosylase [Dothideales sp. JES 119]